ncbi:MAG: alpha/beta hydrolase [Anaerolineae bacterium]|nr:alpha/beta hydrolase [Anaerolineae bacterium]
MSSITTDQGIIHYEVFGRGRPVILLHGWVGSWGFWQDTMAYLSKDYRTYALEFAGFGESDTRRSAYHIKDYAAQVDQFMEQLGIAQAPLVGHSMGGTVSLSVAAQYAHRVSKVAVIGSPIVGSSLSPLLKLFGFRPFAALSYRMMWVFKLGAYIAAPFITRDKNWGNYFVSDLTRTSLEPFLMSIASLRQTDLRPALSNIHVPVMGMYGNWDVIVSPRQWKPLGQGVPDPHIVRFKKAGHFPMLDKPDLFKKILKNFLDGKPLPRSKS